MKKQAKIDILSAVLAIVFGAAVYFFSGSIVLRKKGGDIGSAFMPQLIAGLMIFLGLLLLIKTVAAIRRRPSPEEAEKTTSGEWVPVLSSFINLIVYSLLFRPAGFLISSFIYLVAQMVIMSPRDKLGAKSVGLWTLIAALTSAAVYLIFTKAFTLPLPSGIFG